MQKESEEEHDFDCCSLCLEDFKDPRILPCFHSLCRDCLAEYLEKKVGSIIPGTVFECPLCRAKSDVPKEGIDGIQKNFYLVKSKSVHPMCAEHEDEDLRFYCRNCDFKICRDCKVISHEGHMIEMTKKVYSEVKLKCEDILNVTERKIIEREIKVRGAIEPDILALDTAFSNTDKYVTRIKEEIDTFVKDIKETLKHEKRNKTDTLVKIEAWFDEKRKKIAEEKQRILLMLVAEKRDSVIKMFTNLVSKVDELNTEEGPSFLAEHETDTNGFQQVIEEEPSFPAKHEIDTSGFESEFQQLNETICSAVRKFKLHVAKSRKDEFHQDDKPKDASALKKTEDEFSKDNQDQDIQPKGACALEDTEDETSYFLLSNCSNSDSSDWEVCEERVGPSKSMDEMLCMVQKNEVNLKSERSRQQTEMPNSGNEKIANQENKNGEGGLKVKTSKTKENYSTKNRRSQRVVPEIPVVFNDCLERGSRRQRGRGRGILQKEFRDPRERIRDRNSFRFQRDMNNRAPKFDDEYDFPRL